MENQIAKSASRTHGGGGSREDCWSEEATEVLIDSWGDRYLKLNRGNLRQKDWKEVADAVNSRRDGVRPPRTDVQCKNRVDTLKKKYKQEKSKPSSSKWPFYHHLDHLIGANTVTVSKKSTLSSLQKPQSLSLIVKSEPKASSNPITYSNSSESNESSLGGGSGGGVMKHSLEPVDFTAETAYKELAKAILRFGEIYERIESSKQKQILELEKQRMEFTKELECQRMNMFMEAQLQLEKVKLPTKNASSTGKKV